MPHSYRQEVFNVLLAQLLEERGIISAPEDVLKTTPDSSRKIPDVLVDFSGLRTAIEGEVDDQQGYGHKAISSARKRVEQGIAHIAVAVIYPASLREYPFTKLKSQLSKCELRIAVVTEGGESKFVQGTIDQLGEILRRTFGELVQEDVVAQAVAALEAGIEKFAGTVSEKPGTIARLADVLGIHELPEREKKSDVENNEI